MRIAVTGATGLVGGGIVRSLAARGDEVTVLSRRPDAARAALGVEAVAWDPLAGPAPASALASRDAVVHLAGEPVAQRWTAEAKERIRTSRVTGTEQLVAGLRAAGEERPRTLVCASAVGYYGPRDDEPLDETAPPGDDFLASVCVAWETAARAAEEAGMRVTMLRTGVVLDQHGGALAKMLPPFRLGLGGPVAGGRQWMPWIHRDDLAALYIAALDGGEQWSGPLNAVAPESVTNGDFAKALGRALGRPAVAPVPRLALKALFGEMEQIVATGQRAIPARPLALGFAFRHPHLDEALRDTLA